MHLTLSGRRDDRRAASTSAPAPSPATTTARTKQPTTIEDGALYRQRHASSSRRSRVGKGAYVGSGTTIREDVPAGALAVSAGKQRNIEGWVDKKAADKKKTSQRLTHTMCGIIGYIGPKDVVPVLIDGLRRLEISRLRLGGRRRRARRARSSLRRSAGKLSRLEDVITGDPITGDYGVGHTRWATARPARPKRTRTRTATAPARSSSCTTASSRTISI